MAKVRKKLDLGILLKPTDVVTTIEGELRIGSTSKFVYAFVDGSEREILSADQVQTVENKTIDFTAATGNNTISADSVDIVYDDTQTPGIDNPTLGATDVQAAIDAVKVRLDSQNEASEITYDDTVTTTNPVTGDPLISLGDDVQEALDIVKVALDNQNDADEITYTPDGTKIVDVGSTNTQLAIDDLDTDAKLMRDVSGTVKGDADLGTFSGSTISDNTTIKNGMQELETAHEAHVNEVTGAHASSAVSYISAGNVKVLGVDVQVALDDVETELVTQEDNLNNHLNDTIDAHDASAISYDDSVNVEITGVTEVQGALDQVDLALQTKASSSDLSDHINEVTGAHAASAISNTPSGNLSAIDVQGALNELQTDVDTRALADSGTITNASIETPTRLDVKQDTKTNLETYALTASDGQLVFATDEQKMFQIIDNALQPVGGAGGTTIEISQVAHGLAVGEGIYHNGTSWVKAQANDGATLATFVVTEVPDVDSFVAYQFGRVEVPLHGFTIGEYYFLSNTVAGQPTLTEPTTDFSNPLFYVEDANTLQIMVYRPSVVGEQTPLDDLSDVSTAGAISNQYLKYNGASWEPSFVSEQVIQLTANGPISAGDAVFISSIGQVDKLDCTDDDKIEFIGFSRDTTAGAETIDIATSGIVSGLSGLTTGEFVYADPLNPGGLVQPRPTQTDIYVIIVGKAISATEILINPDLAASAEFNREITINNNTITNNQSTPASVAGAVFNGFRAVVANYSIYRVTDTNEVSQVGQIRLTYKTNAATWVISDDYSGDDAGVTFSVDASGQLLYTSTDLTGANYDSKLQIDVKNLFEV